MGAYYDFELTANLKLDVPEKIVQVLRYLFVEGTQPPSDAPDHAFFSGSWKEDPYISWVKEESAYAGIGVCALRYRPCRYNADRMQYTLHLRAAGKLESIGENMLVFAEWIAPWCMQDECVGYFKAEGEKQPFLLYFHDETLYLLEVDQPPRRITDGTSWE